MVLRRYLFIHQNFPGQFGHIAEALSRRGHEVVSLGVNTPTRDVPGVRHILYPRPAGRPQEDANLAEFPAKVALGTAAARAMQDLKSAGFHPDVVMAHPGWGEALFVRDVFPHARFVVYAEFFYGGEDSDTDFDPEFPCRPDAAYRVRLRNTHLLHALNACDFALTPTGFQKSRHPAWAQDRIHVVHEGIDTQRFAPDAGASVRLKDAALVFRPGDEVVTYVARHLEPYRGFHSFMRSLPALQQLRPRCHVVIVGGDGASYGPPAPAGTSWKKLFVGEVRKHLDMSRVHLVGRVPHALLTQLMQVSAVHVYLTYPFVLSWSLLEAMSIGCLVVGSDTAPVREVVVPDRTGVLADFFDPEGIAKATAAAMERSDGPLLRDTARRSMIERYDLRTVCLPRQLALLDA